MMSPLNLYQFYSNQGTLGASMIEEMVTALKVLVCLIEAGGVEEFSLTRGAKLIQNLTRSRWQTCAVKSWILDSVVTLYQLGQLQALSAHSLSRALHVLLT
jgi:hypothetical protein